MICVFCGARLKKCNLGHMRAKHYSHARRCPNRKFSYLTDILGEQEDD